MTAGIYVHVPFCRQRCHYCTFFSSTGTIPEESPYQSAILNHMKTLKHTLNFDYSVDSVYFGGGTPTLMSPGFFKGILDSFQEREALVPPLEITVEVNPESVTGAYLEELKRGGVNRLSVGAQSFEPEILHLLGRCHDASQTRQVLEWGMGLFDNLSIDLIIGVRGASSRMATVAPPDMLDHVQHISVYILEGTRSRQFQADADWTADQYMAICDHLESHGFQQYEISNFCRPGFQSRHNLHYWNGDPYLGLGPSAHSFAGHVRIGDRSSLAGFLDGKYRQERIEYVADDLDRERVMLSLRTADGVNLEAFRESFREQIQTEVQALAQCFPALLERTRKGYRLTRNGMMLSNEIFEKILMP